MKTIITTAFTFILGLIFTGIMLNSLDIPLDIPMREMVKEMTFGWFSLLFALLIGMIISASFVGITMKIFNANYR